MVYTSTFPFAQDFQALCHISEAKIPFKVLHYCIMSDLYCSAIIVVFCSNSMVLPVFSVFRASQFCVFVMYSEHISWFLNLRTNSVGFYNMNYKPYGIVGREQNKLNWQLNLLNCVYLTCTVILSLSLHTVLATAVDKV